ncbi:MAG: helix-turn-helix transcriptional regulator [Thermoleophilaceae bacterium]
MQRRAELHREAMRVIDARLGDADLSLERVAREIATSSRQLQRAMAEAGGTSFRRELRRARMERAGDLLREGSYSVKEVAGAVGYRQAGQFAKAYRRHHGALPSSTRADV